MNVNVYIVKKGTPESKLLSHAGFDRALLPVDKWKGTSRNRGGYGMSPAAWRVVGEENIRQLCEEVVSNIEKKTSSKRSNQEQLALERANKTLKALDNRIVNKEKATTLARNRENRIQSLLCQRYPSASATEIDKISAFLCKESIHSIVELDLMTNQLLIDKVSIWKEAKNAFINVMKMS